MMLHRRHALIEEYHAISSKALINPSRSGEGYQLVESSDA